MNPLFQQFSNANPMMARIQSIASVMRGDPQAMLKNNPQAQQLIAQHGSAQNAFYALAKQAGVDPQAVMRMLGM